MGPRMLSCNAKLGIPGVELIIQAKGIWYSPLWRLFCSFSLRGCEFCEAPVAGNGDSRWGLERRGCAEDGVWPESHIVGPIRSRPLRTEERHETPLQDNTMLCPVTEPMAGTAAPPSQCIGSR
jgi:hypothetical protein